MFRLLLSASYQKSPGEGFEGGEELIVVLVHPEGFAVTSVSVIQAPGGLELSRRYKTF
jgi:hypothetical protein